MKILIYSNLNNVGYCVGKHLLKLGHKVLLIVDEKNQRTWIENYEPFYKNNPYPEWVIKFDFKRPFLLGLKHNRLNKIILYFLQNSNLMIASDKGIVLGYYYKIPTIFLAHGRDLEILNKKVIKYEIEYLLKKRKYFSLLLQLYSYTYEIWVLRIAARSVINIIYNPFPITMSGHEVIRKLGLVNKHVYLPYPVEIPKIAINRKNEYHKQLNIFWPTRHIWNKKRVQENYKNKGNDIFIRGIAKLIKYQTLDLKIIIVKHGFNFDDSLELIKSYKLENYFEIINPMNRDEVIKRIENSDIVVDQFYEGILGLIGIEAMAYAKPVIGYVSQKIMLRHFGEKMPIANTRTPKDILNVINNLIIEKNRIKLGKESREFVKKYYSVESVVPRILALKNNEGKLLL